ncbi:unnamed protein product [Zymoseptoria tritici ST99CH_3D1]|nr:unnamed protein product [Zymoseptoria tritici ST99CH_3D1]
MPSCDDLEFLKTPATYQRAHEMTLRDHVYVTGLQAYVSSEVELARHRLLHSNISYQIEADGELAEISATSFLALEFRLLSLCTRHHHHEQNRHIRRRPGDDSLSRRKISNYPRHGHCFEPTAWYSATHALFDYTLGPRPDQLLIRTTGASISGNGRGEYYSSRYSPLLDLSKDSRAAVACGMSYSTRDIEQCLVHSLYIRALSTSYTQDETERMATPGRVKEHT